MKDETEASGLVEAMDRPDRGGLFSNPYYEDYGFELLWSLRRLIVVLADQHVL